MVVDGSGSVGEALALCRRLRPRLEEAFVPILFVTDDNDGLQGLDGDITLYHESTDCTGATLVRVFQADLIPFISAFANNAYFPDLPGSTRTIKSQEFDTNTCSTFITSRGLCCESFQTPEDMFTASAVVVPLANLGTPPFRADF